MLQKFSDTELIAKVLNGDKSAFARIISIHQHFVFTLAFRFTRNREDAEEIAQDCFVKAYRSLHTFKQNSKFSTWLYSIVYTTSMTHLRKRRIDTRSLDCPDSYPDIDNLIASSVTPGIEIKSRRKHIELAIDKLSEMDAAIITLFYLGEQSLDEIGTALNLEPGNVKVKLHRARHRLKEKLDTMLKHEAKELL